MRRTDRQVTDTNEILAIMDECDSCAVALMDGEYPYVIEMNFGYTWKDGRLTLYFHGAKEGKKLELIEKNSHAAFAMSCGHQLIPGKVDCATTFQYRSVCGRVEMRMVEGDERMQALTCIMKHFDSEGEHPFTEKHAAAVSIFRMDVEQFTGTRRIAK